MAVHPPNSAGDAVLRNDDLALPGAHLAVTGERGRRYDVEVVHDVRVPTSDPDVTLSADLYLPTRIDPVPALITVIPYRKDFEGGSYYEAALRWFAAYGYACLLVDMRGTGSSDGELRPKYDAGEGDDAVAAIEWAAAQPWCTGDVGMWGSSYGGITSLRAASRRPAALRAIISIATPLDARQHAAHPEGARCDLYPLAQWGGRMLVQQLLPPLLNYTSVQEQRRWQRRLHAVEPYIVEQAARAPGDPVWRDRVIDADSVAVPALCVGGWRDFCADGTLSAFEGFTGPKKLLMGPWMHALPHMSPFEAIDFLPLAARWWDHWLCQIDNGVMDEAPVTLFVQGSNPGWRAYESWPAAQTELTLCTGADTTLTAPEAGEKHELATIAEYQPDPTVGASSGLWLLGSSGFGLPLDQHDDDSRAVSTTSHPLAADLFICGRPEVVVRLETGATPDASIARLVARLTEVDPEGRSTLITAGVRCGGGIQRIVLRPTAYRVRAGNRLRVALSDADFPRLTPLPQASPIRVCKVELSVPTVPEDAGTPVDVPALDRSSLDEGVDAALWTITRDPIHNGIEVAIGTSIPRVSTHQGHVFEMQRRTRSTVRRDAPGGAVTKGTHTAILQMSTGERVIVTAEVRVTQMHLWARGDVEIDGLNVFSRVWEVPMDASHGSGAGTPTDPALSPSHDRADEP